MIVSAIYVISPVDIIPEGTVLLHHNYSMVMVFFSLTIVTSLHRGARCNWLRG